jgi:hypothetical protein
MWLVVVMVPVPAAAADGLVVDIYNCGGVWWWWCVVGGCRGGRTTDCEVLERRERRERKRRPRGDQTSDERDERELREGEQGSRECGGGKEKELQYISSATGFGPWAGTWLRGSCW